MEIKQSPSWSGMCPAASQMMADAGEPHPANPGQPPGPATSTRRAGGLAQNKAPEQRAPRQPKENQQ